MPPTLYSTLPFTLTAETSLSMFAPFSPSIVEVQTPPSVILGFKFQVRLPGTITGLRYWKTPSGGGTPYADLWTDPDHLLTSGTLTAANETANGWQIVPFPTPIPVTPGVNYYAVRRAP